MHQSRKGKPTAKHKRAGHEETTDKENKEQADAMSEALSVVQDELFSSHSLGREHEHEHRPD